MMIRDQPYIVAFIAALFAGIVAVIGATIWLKDIESNKVTKIVIVSKNIAAGEALTIDNITLGERTGTTMPTGSLLEISPLLNRVTKSEMLSGDVIRETSLVPLAIDGSLAAVITSGKRAFSIRVTEEGGVAGFILPGNYIDVLMSTKDNTSKPVSKFLLENILVLAIAQERNKANRSEPKVVNVITLELSPEQAKKLDLAHNTGNLTMVLRNQLDKAEVAVPEAPPPEMKVQVQRPYSGTARSQGTVEVIRGTIRGIE
jgi:pilus assembly protein CpaB